MSIEFIRYFKFLTLSVAIAMGTNIGYSCEVDVEKPNSRKRKADHLQTDIRYWLPHPPVTSEAEVRSFDWRIKNTTGSTLIFDLNNKLVATIYTQRFDPYKGYFGIKFNVSEQTTISQEAFGDILSAQKWVITKAIENRISLQKYGR